MLSYGNYGAITIIVMIYTTDRVRFTLRELRVGTAIFFIALHVVVIL